MKFGMKPDVNCRRLVLPERNRSAFRRGQQNDFRRRSNLPVLKTDFQPVDLRQIASNKARKETGSANDRHSDLPLLLFRSNDRAVADTKITRRRGAVVRLAISGSGGGLSVDRINGFLPAIVRHPYRAATEAGVARSVRSVV